MRRLRRLAALLGLLLADCCPESPPVSVGGSDA